MKVTYRLLTSLLCMLTLYSGPLAAVETDINHAKHFSLSFVSPPEALWNKNRLVATLHQNNQGFSIADQEQKPFNDAELFKIATHQSLPYGKKVLRFRLTLAEDFSPLWHDKAMQFMLNGVELEPATDAEGKEQWKKVVQGDSKGFLPAKNADIWLEITKETTEINSIELMTAGAEHFVANLSHFDVYVWPEADTRTMPYHIHFNHYAYLKDKASPVVIDLPSWLDTQQLTVKLKPTSGDANTIHLDTPDINPQSGQRSLAINSQDYIASHYFSILIPSVHPKLEFTSEALKVKSSLKHIKAFRDQALGAFYYFDSSDYGPYAGSHQQDKHAQLLNSQQQIDVRGGWYDAGDYGKYAVNGAHAVTTLLMAQQLKAEAFSQAINPIANPQRNDLLALLSNELQLLLKLQAPSGGLYHKVASASWPPLNLSPQQDKLNKTVLPITTTATAQGASAFALAAFTYSQSPFPDDRQQASLFKQAALKAWTYLEQHPELQMVQQRYANIEYGGPYDDDNDQDERLLAAIALYKLTQQTHYLDKAREQLQGLLRRERFGDPSPSWRDNRCTAAWLYLMAAPKQDPLLPALKQALITYLNDLIEQQNQSPYGIAYAGVKDQFDWGSNAIIATTGLHLLYGAELLPQTQWTDAALKISHWFFGLNPHGKTFVVGEQSHQVQRPHFRPFVSQASGLPKGLLVGGPNSVELKGDVAAGVRQHMAPMQVYVDHQESWATNEVAINWQAIWSAYLSLLQQQLTKGE